MDAISAEPTAPPPDLLLIDGFKVSLGAGTKLEELLDHKIGDGLAFFVTFEGRVNHSTERRTVNVMLNAKFGYDLGDQIMSRMEEFIKLMKEQAPGKDIAVGADGAIQIKTPYPES